MNVNEVMSTKPVTVSPEESAAVAARLLSRHNIGALPVCGKNGALKGMITDRDIVLRCIAADEDPQTTKVSEIMTRRVFSVEASETLDKATALMAKEQIRRLPVQDKGRVVGMLSLGDLACRPGSSAEAGQALSNISSNVKSV